MRTQEELKQIIFKIHEEALNKNFDRFYEICTHDDSFNNVDSLKTLISDVLADITIKLRETIQPDEAEYMNMLPAIMAELKPEFDKKLKRKFIDCLYESEGVRRMKLSEVLNMMEFSYEVTGTTMRLVDLTHANLGNIQSEEYELNNDLATNVLDRLSTYIEDYFLSDIRERLRALGNNTLDEGSSLEEYLIEMRKHDEFNDNIDIIYFLTNPDELDISDIK